MLLKFYHCFLLAVDASEGAEQDKRQRHEARIRALPRRQARRRWPNRTNDYGRGLFAFPPPLNHVALLCAFLLSSPFIWVSFSYDSALLLWSKLPLSLFLKNNYNHQSGCWFDDICQQDYVEGSGRIVKFYGPRTNWSDSSLIHTIKRPQEIFPLFWNTLCILK